MEPNEPNLDDYMSTYNKRNINNLIYILKQEIEEQTQTNKILKNENKQLNVEDITNFISRNKSEIDYQLTEIETLCEQLTNIVNENTTLRQQEGLYLETLKQEESISVANKLARIKKLKTDIQLFLSNQGIIIPNV